MLNTQKKREYTSILICFSASVLLSVLIFARMRIYPGGKFTLLASDLTEQFLPFIYSLRYTGAKDCSPFFSMLGGLGINNIANYAYYTSSPLNLITLFFPLEKMPDAIYFLTLLKIGLCSASFCTYVLFGLKQRKYRFIVVLLSIAFGVSSFNLLYSMCLMWLDCIFMLPLVLLGVEKIIRDRKCSFFIVSLTLSLYLNYYISYMCGLFLCLYILYRVFALALPRERIKYLLKDFGFSSIISIGLSMPLLLPTLRYTALGKLTETVGKDDQSIIRVSLVRILRNLFPIGETFMRSSGAPQLYCSIITLVLITVFFFSKSFRRCEKIATAAVLLIFIVSFMLVPVDRIWHGFRDPESLPARYAFTCVCFMLILACRALDSKTIDNIVRIISSRRLILYTLISLLFSADIYVNGTSVLMGVNNNSHFVMREKYERDIAQISKAVENIDDNGLYRIVSPRSMTSSDGFMFGYNDVGYYSSVYNADLHNYLKMLGILNNKHKLYDLGITPVTADLLAVKYGIGIEDDFFNAEYITGEEPHAIYRNASALSIGFMAHDSGRQILTDNPFFNQENLVSEILNRKIRLYNSNSYSIETVRDADYARTIKTTAIIESDGPVYVFYPIGSDEDRKRNDIDTSVTALNLQNRRTEEAKCIVNETRTYDFLRENCSNIIYVGDYKKGDELSLYSYSTAYYYDPFVMTLDEDALIQAMNTLSEEQLDITSHSGGILEGSIKNSDGKKLVVSLPYMDGYHIYIDGSRAGYEQYTPAMISINIPDGEHFVRISYMSPGFIPGLIIGFISLGVFIAFVFHRIRSVA